jgi:hypothetical protein
MAEQFTVRPLLLAILFFIVFGVVLITFGVIYLLFSPKRLDELIVEYNHRVDAWQNVHRQEFESFQFNLTLLDLQNSPAFPYTPQTSVNFELQTDLTPDKMYKDYFNWLHKYHPLKYTLEAGTLMGTLPMYINFSQTVDMELEYLRLNNITLPSTFKSKSTVMSYPLFVKLPFHDPTCQYGFYEDRKCYLVYVSCCYHYYCTILFTPK